MYAIAILPLIQRLYADDATAGGGVDQLRSWWDNILKIGPEYGYLANPTKTWLIVKEEYLSAASEAFHNTGVQITSQGNGIWVQPWELPLSLRHMWDCRWRNRSWRLRDWPP